MLRWVVVLAAAAAVLGAMSASGAGLQVNGGVLQVFVIPADLSPISAGVDIKPESLQKRSQGQNVTAEITLPPGFDVNNIQVQSVRLCRDGNCIGAQSGRVSGSRFIAEFRRADVIGLIQNVTPPATVMFRVVGVVQPPGRPFEGSDTVRVVDPELTPTPTATPTLTRSPTPTATPTPTAPVVVPSPRATPPAAPTATPTPTPSPIPTPTATPGQPPATLTPTPTASPSPTAWPTATPTAQTPSPTPTAAATPTPTGTATPVPTPTRPAAPSPTPRSG